MKILLNNFAEELSLTIKDFFEVEEIKATDNVIKLVFSNGQVFNLSLTENEKNLLNKEHAEAILPRRVCFLCFFSVWFFSVYFLPRFLFFHYIYFARVHTPHAHARARVKLF